ncbi:MAG: phosphatidylinositol-specific phospholipase C [Pseudonocardiaceae bacterium]
MRNVADCAGAPPPAATINSATQYPGRLMADDQRETMAELVSRPSWMRNIPDDAPLTTLSIPGTHNSCSLDGPLGVGKTQNHDLSDQLDAGIRFFDIRLAHHQDDLCVHHDIVCMERRYSEVLTNLADFLKRHPSETILLSISNEDRVDSALGKLAPSQVLCKLSSMASKDCPDENTRSFEDTFNARTQETIGDAPLFYNFGPARHTLTSGTTLGELRGKIVLLRRFEAGDDVGFDTTYWPENQSFRSAVPPFYDIEDRYQNPGDDNKFDFVVSHLEDARSGDPKDLFITFSSAVDLTARGYAETINPRLNDYLAASPPGRLGIVVMDYFEKPPDLVPNVIKANST